VDAEVQFSLSLRGSAQGRSNLSSGGKIASSPDKALAPRNDTSETDILKLKQLGFSDKKIAQLCGKTEFISANSAKLTASVRRFQIDTWPGKCPLKPIICI